VACGSSRASAAIARTIVCWGVSVPFSFCAP
jgi:hypothetical protein